ncbi:MAG: replication initiation protein, partial [Enterococcus faecalis]|nr:replication initiation protein [Enterococcus faecalis]
MSKKNHSNHLRNKDLDNFSKTGYSNSRLSAQIPVQTYPNLSFDAMTIVGNLNKINAQKLSEFMSTEPQIRLWDILQTKFKAKALQE